MKKRWICLCVLALMLVCVFVLPATAEAATEGNYTYTVSNGEATITECKDSVSGDLTIPSTLGGYPVTAIGEQAFTFCSELTSVVIPNGVTTIGDRAFRHCRGLTSVIIPDSVTTLGPYAFYNCRALPSVTIPDSVNTIGESAFGSCVKLTAVTIPDGVTTLGKGMFEECESLTSVTLPDSLLTIGERAFAYCKSLTVVTLPDNLMTIGDFAFLSCSSLTVVNIPDGVNTIGADAFQYCKSLTAVTIPDSVTTIDSYAFSYCSSLTSATIGERVTSIGQYAFSNCKNLTSITIPDSVVTLGRNAFSYCSGLASVTFGKGLTTISDETFAGCEKLETITIPDNVTTIGSQAFKDCGSLTSVTLSAGVTTIKKEVFLGCDNLTGIWVDRDNPTFSSDDKGVLYNKEKTKLVQVPYGLTGTYAIANTVTEIGDYAFYNCKKLEGVEIPVGVTVIGNYAFCNCTSLTEVTIPDRVATIGDYTFDHCNNLTSVTIGESVAGIGKYAFRSCDKLAAITIADGVITIEEYAFAKCVGLVSVTLGKSLTTIGKSAFSECEKLETITLSDNVTTIGTRAFENCGSLTSVTLSAGVTTIENHAFLDCNNLTGIWVDQDNLIFSSDDKGVLYNKEKTKLVQVPYGLTGTYTIVDTVTEIGEYAVYNCKKLEGVEIPAGVTTIGSYAFAYCKNLTGVFLPTSITTIGDYAFQSCAGLRILTIPKGVTTIGNCTFERCIGLTSLTIPDSVKTIGDRAFDGCIGLTTLTISDSVTSISMNAFLGCEIKKLIIADGSKKVAPRMVVCEKTLEEVVIPDSVTEIESYAFSTCPKLLYVKIPDKVKVIRKYTFHSCKSLVLVWLPKSLVEVEESAFGNCGSLTEVYYDGFDRELEKVTVGEGNEDFLYATLYCKSSLSIVTQPKTVVVKSGKTAKVTVKATGTGLKYTWYYAKKGSSKYTKVSGSSATYSVKMSSSVDGRKVYCVVTDKYGSSVKSDVVTLYKGTPAKITTQPKGLTVISGKTAKLTIKAVGDGAKYAWYYMKPGATKYTKSSVTATTFSVKMSSAWDNAKVYCVVMDKFGNAVKSSVVTIKQAPVPKITTQPKSIAEVNGKTVKFSVKASGEGLKYQWYYAKKGSSSFKKLSGKTSATYSVKVSSSVNGRKYYCRVTDKYGQTVKSSAVSLTLKTVAKITTQPKGVTVVGGSTAKLTVKAVGDGAKYTWYYLKKGETKYTKSSVTASTFSVKMADTWDGAQVYCAVSDKYGNTVKSTVVTIKQAPQPKITTQPKSVLQVKGKTVKFTVKASGEGLKYQWYYAKKGSSSFKKLSGKTSATYSVKVSSSVNGRKYYCLVTDKYGQTVKSSVVTLTLKTVAKITTQPKSVSVKNGKTAKVTIKAVGDGLTYTWYYLKPGATKYTKSSITSATFSVKMAAAWKNAKVYCVIADKYGNTVKSKVVTMKMK